MLLLMLGEKSWAFFLHSENALNLATGCNKVTLDNIVAQKKKELASNASTINFRKLNK